MNKFYAIAGINGLGVYRTWARAKESLKFLSYQRYKGFNNFEDAANYARDNFNLLNQCNYNGPVTLDFTLYRRDLYMIERLKYTANDKIRVNFDDMGNQYIVKVDERGNIIEGMPLIVSSYN